MPADPANYDTPNELAGDSSKANGLSNGLKGMRHKTRPSPMKLQALLRPNEKS